MKLRTILLSAIAGATCFGLVACGSTPDPQTATSGHTINIAVIHSGSKSDPYAAAQLDGLNAAIQELGPGKFTVKVVDNVPFTEKLTQTTEQLLRAGSDVVIDLATAGQLFYDACKKFPDKRCLEGYPVGEMPANTAGFWYDLNSIYYLEGIAARMLSENPHVGFVNAIPVPGSRALVNSFALGCRSVDPKCAVSNVYINSFTDPAKEVESVKTLVAQGTSVLGHYMDDPATLKTASQLNAWSFGLYTDQRDQAARYITSPILTPAAQKVFTAQLKRLLDDQWNPGKIEWGTPAGTLDIALGPWGDHVPQNVRDAVEAAYNKMNNGFNPFRGPITDTAGTVRLAEGQQADPRDPNGLVYSSWDWSVEGVIGG